MTFTLRDAAEFLRTRKAPAGFRALLRRVKRVLTFRAERENRAPRFLRIVAAYKDPNRSVADIAAEFECSRSTVLRYARLAGLPKRPRGFDDQIRSTVIAMYRDKTPIADIAAKCGVSQAYVSKLATEVDINRKADKRRK